MDTSEVMEIIREEFDPDHCEACDPECLALLEMPVPPVAMIDVLGIRWCAAHQFRGEFVNLMSAYDWPALQVYDEERVRVSHKIEGEIMRAFEQPFYEVAAGVQATVRLALSGSDECVTMLALKAMDEHRESEVA